MIAKRPKTWWLLTLLLAALLAVAAACDDDGGGDEDGTPAPQTEVSPTESAALPTTPPEDIVTREDVLSKDPSATKTAELEWGFMFELTGGIQAGFGIPTGDGVLLAVEEINESGGFQVGDTVYTINLLERDTKSDTAQTIAVATELVQDDQVNVIWGPATVGETQITPLTQANQVLHLCPCQERETTALSSVEKAQGESHWAFQTLLPFSLLIEQGARNFIKDWPDVKTFAILCQNTETGQDVCGRTADAYQKVGLELVGEEFFPPETTDYTPFLTQLRSGDPDYLFNFDNPPNQVNILRQALELDVGRLQTTVLPATLVEALVARDLTVPVIAGAAARQCAQPTSQDATDYCERYRAFKGGELPVAEFVSLMTYDYAYMLIAAMQQAGTVEDTTAIADALEGIHYDGVSEDDMFFNSRHLAVHGTESCLVQSGRPITCEHDAPPPEAAR